MRHILPTFLTPFSITFYLNTINLNLKSLIFKRNFPLCTKTRSTACMEREKAIILCRSLTVQWARLRYSYIGTIPILCQDTFGLFMTHPTTPGHFVFKCILRGHLKPTPNAIISNMFEVISIKFWWFWSTIDAYEIISLTQTFLGAQISQKMPNTPL